MEKQYYTISYDNFYMSRDIVTLDTIDNLIQKHRELEESGQYSLFSCCSYENLVEHRLNRVDENTYRLTLFFKDDDLDQSVTLHKCNMY